MATRIPRLLPALALCGLLFPALPVAAATEILDPAADTTVEAPPARVATPGQKKARKARAAREKAEAKARAKGRAKAGGKARGKAAGKTLGRPAAKSPRNAPSKAHPTRPARKAR